MRGCVIFFGRKADNFEPGGNVDIQNKNKTKTF